MSRQSSFIPAVPAALSIPAVPRNVAGKYRVPSGRNVSVDWITDPLHCRECGLSGSPSFYDLEMVCLYCRESRS